MLKIPKIQRKPNIIIISGVIIIICVIVVTFLVSGKKQPKLSEKYPTNPENIISPAYNQSSGYEITDYSKYFSQISNEPYYQIENYIYHWQGLFDIFASNRANTRLKYEISKSNLTSISQRVKKAQLEFFKGSSDEILAEYGKLIKEDAGFYKIDWRLILAIIKQESDFTSTAVSHAGAYGFMQIMPKTGSSLEQTLNLENHTSPTNNLIAGIYYYALLLGRYDEAGDPNKYELALAAYNCGSGHVEDAMTIVYHDGKDFLKWDNVSEALKKLGPQFDTLHTKVWNAKPPTGVFTNWKEPVNYVYDIMYYWGEYKKIYPIPEDKPKSEKKHKKSKTSH